MSRIPRLSPLVILLGAALLLAAGPALAADPDGKPLYERGAEQYQNQQYQAAASSFEAAIQASYRTGDTYYKLGLAYAQLKRYDEALWAYGMARSVDPGIAGGTKIDEKTTEARAKGSGTPRTPAFAGDGTAPPAASPPAGSDPVVETLRQRALYVAPGMAERLSGAAAQRVEQQAASLAGRGHTVRFALIEAAPRSFGSLGAYVDALHTDLKLGEGILIVADSGGVSAKSDLLTRAQMQDLTTRGAATFRLRGYDAGFVELSSAVAGAADSQQASSNRTTLVVVLVLLGLGLAIAAAILIPRRGRWQAALGQMTREREQADNLVLALEREVPYLPGDEAGQTVRQTYAEGLEALALGKSQLAGVQRWSGWSAALRPGRPWGLLTAARGNLDAAILRFQEAAKAGNIDLDDVAAVAAPGQDEPRACFFCGRRLQPSEAEMAAFTIGGEERRVVVCPDHAADLKAGRRPQVRGVETEPGHFVPWYTVPYYDPAYSHYQTTDLGWDSYSSYSSWQPESRVVIYHDPQPDDQQYARAAQASFTSTHPGSEGHESGASFSSFDSEPSGGAAETRWDTGGDRS